jgi:hypothetical protein
VLGVVQMMVGVLEACPLERKDELSMRSSSKEESVAKRVGQIVWSLPEKVSKAGVLLSSRIVR